MKIFVFIWLIYVRSSSLTRDSIGFRYYYMTGNITFINLNMGLTGVRIYHTSLCVFWQKECKSSINSNQSQKTFLKKDEKPKQKLRTDQKCRDFNYKGNCSFNPCKFIHACDVPGCNDKHPAINHVTSKNQ